MILGPVTCKDRRTASSGIVKMSILLVLFTFLQSSHSIQIHQQAKPSNTDNVYNKNLYLQELTNIQNRFRTDLNQIKDKFTQMNQELSSTNASSSSQVITLQETLAEERDALYNIQQYLNVPFALKSCECLNFTEDQKKQLQTQINEVNQQIQDLKSKLTDKNGKPYENPECLGGNCPVMNQLRSQIGQLEAYARVMKATAESKCCNKTTYLFRDNLAESSFWVYGNITDKEYRQELAERGEQGKMASCPKSLPFADYQLNQCFACSQEKPLFSLEERTCVEGCSAQNLTLNVTTHICDYNRSCGQGNIFSDKLKKCVQDKGTSSRCPQDRPVWDDETLSCQQCSKEHPFYDINVRSCRSCTENQIWDEYTRTCYSKLYYHPVKCPNGSHYNTLNRKCETDEGVTIEPQTPPKTSSGHPSTGVSASCPPDEPYWDAQDFVCAKCPLDTPKYNETTSKCQPCPPNTKWHFDIKVCVEAGHNCSSSQFWNKENQQCESLKVCKSDEIFNMETGQCDKEGPQTGNIGLCPPETPFWNDESLSCEHCPLKTPKWNDTTHQCQACPSNSAYDVTTKKCKQNITCANGTFYSSKTHQCEAIQCPSDKPLFNGATRQCEACHPGFIYNYETKSCEVNGKAGKASVCPEETPYWNHLRLACQRCPEPRRYNQKTKKCELPGAKEEQTQ